MQIIGELLIQMGINTGIARTTKNLNGRQIMLSLKKKQTTELKSRGQTTLWFELLIPSDFNSVPVHAVLGKADQYNSHSNIKAAIKLNYNSRVKKKKSL